VDRGIEEEALGWAEELLAALRAGDAAAWGGRLMAGTRLDDPAAAAFWERHGFAPGEHVEVNLLRRLDGPLPAAPLPAGWQVRPVAGPEEAEARAMAQRLVWHPWSVSRVSGNDYARLMALPGYHRDLDVVAVAPDGRIASYVNGWLDPRNGSGDLGPVGTLADYRQRGLARATLLACMAQMQARGMDRVCGSTGQRNAPALALYESLGFQRVNGFREYSRP
jgi:ribosomal protein S18 acetylase RimI-like enzyme